jgi:hypothetical protein
MQPATYQQHRHSHGLERLEEGKTISFDHIGGQHPGQRRLYPLKKRIINPPN